MSYLNADILLKFVKAEIPFLFFGKIKMKERSKEEKRLKNKDKKIRGERKVRS